MRLRAFGWWALVGAGCVILILQVIGASRQMNDFCQDYGAVHFVLQGQSPYGMLRCWTSAGVRIPAPIEYDAHPPSSVLLFLSLGLLPRLGATLLWGVSCVAMYLATGWLLLKELRWRLPASLALFALGSAFWPPAALSAQLLNFAQLLTLLLLVAWLLERRGHTTWAGIVLGLAGLLKFWPAALLLGFVLQRRWKPALAGCVTLVVGSLLTLLVLGWHGYADYLGPVQANERYWVPSDVNLSLVGVVARPFTGYPENTYTIPALVSGVSLATAVLLGECFAGLVLVGALCWLVWCCRRGRSQAEGLLTYGVLLTVVLLVFPMTWYWEAITLLLPCATLILALRQLPRPPSWWWIALEASLLVLFGGAWLVIYLANWLFQRHLGGLAGWATLLFDVPSAALVVFAGLQAWVLWQVSSKKVETPSVLVGSFSANG